MPSETDPRGVILAPNHASFLDPPIVGISLRRPVTFLAKEYLFKTFFIGWVLRSVGSFPIRSESEDFRSIRELVRRLKEGACVVIFPEGTRSPDGSLRSGESGVGFIAMKSRAYVVPVYIEGSYEAFPRDAKMFRARPIRTFYGDPFVPAEDPAIAGAADPYAATSARIMDEIGKLKAAADASKRKV